MDGIVFSLSPKDSEDDIVPVNGTVIVKLWKAHLVDDCLLCWEKVCGDDEPVEVWNVNVTENQFSGFLGLKVKLPFNNYVPGNETTTCAEVTLLAQGKEFKVEDDAIYLD